MKPMIGRWRLAAAGIVWLAVRTAPPVGQPEKKAPREAIRKGTAIVAAGWRRWTALQRSLCMIGAMLPRILRVILLRWHVIDADAAVNLDR